MIECLVKGLQQNDVHVVIADRDNIHDFQCKTAVTGSELTFFSVCSRPGDI